MNTQSLTKRAYPLFLWATVLMFWALSAISGTSTIDDANRPFRRHLLEPARYCKTIKIFLNGDSACEEKPDNPN